METGKPVHISKLYYGYIIVTASTLIMVGALGIHYAFGVFFKPLIADFNWSRAATSGAVSLSFVIQGLSSVGLGAMNDRYGPRLTLSLSGLVLGLGYILMSQVNSLWQLYLFYGILVGTGLGGMFVPVTSSVARWFERRRGTMTGIVISGIGIGTLIAPLVANIIISSYDWRRSYLILGLAALVIIVTAAQFMRPHPKNSSEMPKSEKTVKGLIRNTEGFLFAEAIRTRQFWVTFTMIVCFGICTYVILVHIVPFATDLEISSSAAAGILSAIGGASILGKVVFGRMGDKIGNRNVYIICFVLMALSLLWLLVANSSWMLYIFAVVFALAYAGCGVSLSPITAYLFGLKRHGAILGALNFGYNLGAAIGPTAAGYLFDIQGNYHSAFFISAAIAIMGLILALVLKPDGYLQPILQSPRR